MLDAFIIEELRRREKEERDRPRLELPVGDLHMPPADHRDKGDEDGNDKPRRGVIIVDL